MFWWNSYIFNGYGYLTSEEGLKKYQENFKNAIRWLPERESPIVPDAEHTILFPFSILVLIFTILEFKK